MKVLHILNELKRSGAEVMLNVAHGRFRQDGIESHILCSGEQIGEYAEVLAQTGFTLHHLPFRKNVTFFLELYRLLRRERFAVVHLHTERAFFWYTVVARLARVPTVVRTFHAIFAFDVYLRRKRKLQRKLSRKLLKSVHTAIGDSVCRFEKERFDNDCVLVRNWIDTARFSPPSERQRSEARRLCSLADGDIAVATVGACEPVKNHMALLAAAAEANRRLDRSRIVVLHVGTGSTLEQETAFVRERKLESVCRWLGSVNDVRPCLHAADIFAMTSLQEGLGNAALEAMSTGLPVVLFDVYGLRDLLADGKGGILVDPREDALTDALLALLRDPNLAQEMGREARYKVLNTYSVERSVAALVELYAGSRRCDSRYATIPR